ncbi:MAG: hypothetical protein L0G94_10635 [Brachybacterium sp.]|uniref:hypothetical protein n=1 Tax=Brachybacterium sp. TaxID=1891286 RepID=UPI00264974BE|nr:hypothetical protein [Brachybacterium sp.]MDN5687112.1 hypothetical protein [Brachybacterium sp.]
MVEIKLEEDDEGRKKLWQKRDDGSWEEVEPEQVSDDPDVDEMGNISIDEFEEILEDEDHPKHKLAKEYNKVSGERLRETMAPFLENVGKQYSSIFKDIIGPRAMPGTNIVPDIAKAVPDVEPMTSRGVSLPDLPDFEPIRNPTYDVLDEVLKTNTHLSAMVKQAKSDAEDQRKNAAKSQKHARWSIGAAWAAVGVTVIVGVVQICQNM